MKYMIKIIKKKEIGTETFYEYFKKFIDAINRKDELKEKYSNDDKVLIIISRKY